MKLSCLEILALAFVVNQCCAWIPYKGGVTTAFGSKRRTSRTLPFNQPRGHFPVPPLQATSSSKLKRKNPNSPNSPPSSPKGPRGSVVERLSQAASQAKLRVEKSEKAKKARAALTSSMDTAPDDETEKLASLESLTAAIEAKLEKSRQQTLHNQNRDAMTEVLKHNENVPPIMQQQHNYNSTATIKQVAILLTKPLQNDRITVEHANRVRRLVRAMIKDQYRPNVICFVGPLHPGNLVADADASYLFFLELCAAQNITVHGIDIHLVKGSVEDGALEQISYFLKETCSPLWAMDMQKKNKKELTGRLRVHFTLISSEYELCQLNDIHERSPGRSPLRTLTDWSSRSCETTWTYLYTSTILPPHESNDVTRMFRSKTFKSAQELIPVLQHLRGVAENREFFQIEAYRVLVAARRSIVKDMELLYHRPKLHLHQSDPLAQSVVSVQSSQSPSTSSTPIDVVLESASLSLGRCLDLVRPAGRGDGIVSSADWALSAVMLEKSISQILRVCDTDGPVDPQAWGSMGENDDSEAVQDYSENPTSQAMEQKQRTDSLGKSVNARLGHD